MSDNRCGAFEGFGRHTINDFLYLCMIFPGTPSYRICLDDTIFAKLEVAIPKYMENWTSATYHSNCSGGVNTNNPFDYNYKAQKKYVQLHIQVFRRTCVKVPEKLYNEYLEAGLFDPDHTIGEFLSIFYLYLTNFICEAFHTPRKGYLQRVTAQSHANGHLSGTGMHH